MENQGIYTNAQEIEIIRRNLKKYDWYTESFRNIKKAADEAVKRGLAVPEKSGFVFYETCPRDDTALIFDPYNPRDHICPKCGMNYQDECYQEAWITQKHSWLSQMAVLIGIVYAVQKDEMYAKALRDIFLEYLKYYPDYPNNDNELGPTKVFQSTYMESVWINYLAGAYDMVKSSCCFKKDERKAIERDLFSVSANVIRDYDEKMNNRQAFNNAGLIAVGFILEDSELVDYAINGIHGFVRHMNDSVLEDGLWYEGDNYHFATVPSIVNIAEACRHNGIDLYSKEYNGHTIKMLFDAPLKSLQPDLTFPSRKDSRFANHFAQKWYAGLYELAYSRYQSPSYAKMLKQIYAFKGREDINLASAAGIMEIFRAQVSKRSNLDWRGFLNTTPDLGDAEGLPFTCSLNMTGTGLAVLRKGEGRLYASLDYGKYGGGHGHPDRLNANLFVNGHRLLTDWGTGNYYFDHLNWYRSTIGHNTLNVDGNSQVPVDGKCTIFEDTPEVSVMSAAAPGISPGVDAKRSMILLDNGLMFDFMEADSDKDHRYHYALHSYGKLELDGLNTNKVKLEGENYRFLNHIQGAKADHSWLCSFREKDYDFIVRMDACKDTTVYKAEAYGPPDRIPELFPVLIVERNGSKTQYAALMEAVESGNESLVDSFTKIAEGTYGIHCKSGISYELGKRGDGWYVLAFEKGILKFIGSFCLDSVEGSFRSAMPLKSFVCRLDKDTIEIQTQPVFGEITLNERITNAGGLNNREIMLNGKAIKPEIANDCIILRCNATRTVHMVADKLYKGIENRIPVELHNYTDEVWKSQLDVQISSGWRIVSAPDVNIMPYSAGVYEIGVVQSASADHEHDGKVKLSCSGVEKDFAIAEPLEIEVHASRDNTGCFIIGLKNVTHQLLDVKCSLCDKEISIKKQETREIFIPADSSHVSIQDGILSIPYTVRINEYLLSRVYSKQYTKAKQIVSGRPINSIQWQPDIFMTKESQVRRGEKHWTGTDDLSAEAMIFAHDNGLAFRIKVKDDKVLISGGKFFFDNDSVQIYFDRRQDKFRKIPYITEGVYGFALLPGVNGESSTVRTIGFELDSTSNIGISIYIDAEGYEILLDIPWDIIGGKPSDNDIWGFDIIVNDRDSGVRRDLQMLWSGCFENERTYLMQQNHNPMRFGLLLFK